MVRWIWMTYPSIQSRARPELLSGACATATSLDSSWPPSGRLESLGRFAAGVSGVSDIGSAAMVSTCEGRRCRRR